jgi:saccharopine dehydrogenase-like NADP-dependent oxidoreductase
LRSVLILGAGLVAGPVVRYFLERGDVELTVATLFVEDAEALIDGHPRGTARAADVRDPGCLEPLIRGSELVISLVPFALHPIVAGLAVRCGVDVVTTSYVAPEMQALDAEAREAGVMLLNEIGLDPGIDHLAATRMIHDAAASGATIDGFFSCCGGLPSPEAADNPWRYKFSWSPRGALLAGRQSARYLRDGRIQEIPGERLFEHHWPYTVEGVGRFEVYPNRDSLRYVDLYGLEGVQSMLRGTIRYPGWCETMLALARLGLLDVDERSWPAQTTYAGLLASALPPGPDRLERRVAAHLDLAPGHPVLERLRWVGLFSDEPISVSRSSPLDVLAGRFERMMAYAEGERDMVLQRHELHVSWPDGRAERRVSLLVAYGEPGGDSATSRTVSLPAAAAASLILDRRVHEPGVHIPTRRDLAEPILEQLGTLGIGFEESVRER